MVLFSSVLFGLFLIFSGCTKDNDIIPEIKKPVAAFSISDSNPIAGGSISFTNQSLNASHYEWDFGDGNSSNSTSPAHIYEIPGNYTITLIAYGELDNTSSSKEITVKGSIFPGISIDNIQLGDSFGNIKSQYSGSNYDHFVVCGNICIHLITYDDLGLVFGFANFSPVLGNADATIGIFAESPYSGYTDTGLRVGSTKSDVIGIYGDPEDIDADYGQYEYPSLGIDFTFDGAPEAVSRMFVYDADGFAPNISKDEFKSIIVEIQ